jgi:Rrf2 family protein
MFDIAYHAEAEPKSAAQAKEIARREDIPLRYLEQIFQDLKRAGLVESKRGPRGGYYLKRDAADISLGEVVVALQGPVSEMFVVERDAAEDDSSQQACSRHVTAAVWKELADQVAAWLEAVSIADLVKRGVELGVPRAGAGQPMYFI